jgi:hypothetical protein
VWSTVAVLDPVALAPDVLAFLAERHVGTLSTVRSDGTLHVSARDARDPAAVADAVARHAARYREPRPNPARVAIEIEVVRVLGRAG